MKQLVRNVKIVGTGSYVPETVYTNEYLETIVPTNAEWIYENVGIRERHIAAPNQTTSDLATEAGKRALEDAGLQPSQIDLIIVATATADRKAPSTAAFVQHKLNAYNAAAFDVSAVCSGFLFAMSVASQYIASGVYNHVLVIGADTFSRITDWTRRDCIFFGDGAGAVYVEAAEDEEDTYSFVQHSDGVKGMVLKCGTRDLNNPLYKGEEQSKFVWMDGREIFKFAVGQIPVCINEAMDKAGLTKDNIDLFILHQANKRIISSIAKRMELPEDRFPTNVERVGNMSSAAIPVLLDECNRNGQLKKGMRLVLSGFGAGLTFGASIISW